MPKATKEDLKFGVLLTRAQRDAWVAALLSGEYEQGSGFLYLSKTSPIPSWSAGSRPGYCCLGVLGEAVFKRTKAEMEKIGYLPYDVISSCLQNEFSGMNDVDEIPFELLAGFIAENLPTID